MLQVSLFRVLDICDEMFTNHICFLEMHEKYLKISVIKYSGGKFL